MDGAVKFNVSANTAQFDAAMSRVGSVAQTTSDKVRSAFSGLGGVLAGGALVAGMQNVLRQMDDISDRAKRFGVSAEEIQKVGNAADIVGTNFESVARTIARAGVAANKAAREGGSIAEAFSRINIDPAKFAAATLEERINMIAAAQRAASGDAQKMADVLEAVGVKASGINFSELASEMQKVNVAGADVVERLAEANDQLDKMKQGVTIFAAEGLSGVVDYFERIGSIIGEGDGSILSNMTKLHKLAMQLSPFAGIADMLGFGGKTVKQMEEEQSRLNAIAALRSRGELSLSQSGKPLQSSDVFLNTEKGQKDKLSAEENERRITAEVERLKKAQEDVAKAASDAALSAGDYEQSVARSNEQLKTTKQLLVTASKENGAIQFSPEQSAGLAALKDAQSEIVVELNRRLEEIKSSGADANVQSMQSESLMRQFDEAMQLAKSKSDQIFGDAVRNSSNAQDVMLRQASQTESQRQERQQSPAPSRSESQNIATETTLQRVATFLEQLNTKLPQPVFA